MTKIANRERLWFLQTRRQSHVILSLFWCIFDWMLLLNGGWLNLTQSTGWPSSFFPEMNFFNFNKSTSYPKLVKSKCVWQLYIFFCISQCWHTSNSVFNMLPWSSSKTLDYYAWEFGFKTLSKPVLLLKLFPLFFKNINSFWLYIIGFRSALFCSYSHIFQWRMVFAILYDLCKYIHIQPLWL